MDACFGVEIIMHEESSQHGMSVFPFEALVHVDALREGGAI